MLPNRINSKQKRLDFRIYTAKIFVTDLQGVTSYSATTIKLILDFKWITLRLGK